MTDYFPGDLFAFTERGRSDLVRIKSILYLKEKICLKLANGIELDLSK